MNIFKPCNNHNTSGLWDVAKKKSKRKFYCRECGINVVEFPGSTCEPCLTYKEHTNL